jgi:hypothetical protein
MPQILRAGSFSLAKKHPESAWLDPKASINQRSIDLPAGVKDLELGTSGPISDLDFARLPHARVAEVFDVASEPVLLAEVRLAAVVG